MEEEAVWQIVSHILLLGAEWHCS